MNGTNDGSVDGDQMRLNAQAKHKCTYWAMDRIWIEFQMSLHRLCCIIKEKDLRRKMWEGKIRDGCASCESALVSVCLYWAYRIV